MTLTAAPRPAIGRDPGAMRATVFHGPGDIRVQAVPRPPCCPTILVASASRLNSSRQDSIVAP